MRKINNIVIHCTAGYGNLASIQAYWRKKLGWHDPGYHFIVDQDGTVHPVWPIAYESNGVKGHNSDSVHVSYIGGVEPDDYSVAKDTRTASQKRSIVSTIKQIIDQLKKHQPVDQLVIKGHRDFSDDTNGNGVVDTWERIKECPCFDAIPEYAWITKSLRK